MEKKFNKIIGIVLTLFMFSTLFTGSSIVFAEDGAKAEANTSEIVKSVELLVGGENRFGNTDAIVFPDSSKARLKINLKYNSEQFTNKIKEGDKLSLQLVPEEGKKFIQIEFETSQKNELTDTDTDKDKPISVAKVDMESRESIDLTFLAKPNIEGEAKSDLTASFSALLDIPYEVDSLAINKYFKEHEDQESVQASFYFAINGNKDLNKKVTFVFKKPEKSAIKKRFYKTKGTYKQVGDLGKGYFTYNLVIDTLLASPNEYVIYDLPATNLEFNGYVKVFDSNSSGKFDQLVFMRDYTNPKNPTVIDKGTRINVYEVYYVDTDQTDPKLPGIPKWTEEKLKFNRNDNAIANGTYLSQSTITVPVPENVLVETALGTKLSEEDQKKINDNVKKYGKVGKGFKMTISDYKSDFYEEGGYLTIVYQMSIKDVSYEYDADLNPKYKNFATVYGQEIPICDSNEDKNCRPVRCEKTLATDYGAPGNPAEGFVTPGKLTATVDIPEVQFTKVVMKEGKLTDTPVEGAEFTIYKSDKNGNKNGIAKNDNGSGIELKELVTDGKGKLTKGGEVVPLNLSKGYYVFEETKAPESFEIVNKDTLVGVSYQALNIKVGNKKNEDPNQNPDTKPNNPTIDTEPTPVETEKPVIVPEVPETPKPAPTITEETKIPESGDSNNVSLWVLAVMVTLGLAFASTRVLRKKH